MPSNVKLPIQMHLSCDKRKAKKASARRVSSKTGRRLRCSSVEDPQGIFSFVAPRRRPVLDETAASKVF